MLSAVGSKAASLMVWGCISAYGMVSLHVLEGTMNAERYIKVLEQHMLPPDDMYFREGLVYLSRTVQTHILQLLQQHGFIIEDSGAELVCLPDLSLIENIWLIIKRKIRPNSNTKTPETHNLDAQMSSKCFEKKRRCYTIVNTPPSQLFETCSRHQI